MIPPPSTPTPRLLLTQICLFPPLFPFSFAVNFATDSAPRDPCTLGFIIYRNLHPLTWSPYASLPPCGSLPRSGPNRRGTTLVIPRALLTSHSSTQCQGPLQQKANALPQTIYVIVIHMLIPVLYRYASRLSTDDHTIRDASHGRPEDTALLRGRQAGNFPGGLPKHSMRTFREASSCARVSRSRLNEI